MAARQLLRSCTAELEQLAASISSSRDLASLSDQRQLQGLLAQVLLAYKRQPPASFDDEQQAFMLAAVKLLPVLADDRHPRDCTWVVLLCEALHPWAVIHEWHRVQVDAWFGQHSEWPCRPLQALRHVSRLPVAA
jgi:hypothetical protein